MISNKLKLTAILLMTAVPLTLATYMFSVKVGHGFGATTNKGILISPILDITSLDMRDEKGSLLFKTFEEEVAGISPQDYQARPWLLVFLGTQSCDSECEDRLYYLRQLHRRLGKDEPRVNRYYLNAGQNPLDAGTQQMFAQKFPDMKVAYGDAQVILDNLARTLRGNENPIQSHYIYVVDPVGNVMLYFTPENSPEDILSDLQKLLNQSSLG